MLKAQKQAAIPPGEHNGNITACRETTKVFDQEKGPEPVVEVTIRPEWKAPDGAETLAVAVIFSPVLNGLSALSKFLERCGVTPEEGHNWEPSTIVGKKVRFVAESSRNGFIRVLKDSIRAV